MTRCLIGLLIVLTLGLLVAPLAADAQETAPSLTLSLNQASFGPRETLILTATTTPGAPRPVDVYLVLELPDGKWLYYRADGLFTPTEQPFVSNWTVAPSTGEIFHHTLSGCEQGGSYRWLAAFTEPGTLTVLGPIAQAPFALDTPRLIEVSGNNQTGPPGEVLPNPFLVRVVDQFGQPIEGCPVTFSVLQGDGTFVGSSAARTSIQSLGPGAPPSFAAPQQTTGASVTVVTGPDGLAAASYQPGQEPLQIVAAQVPGVPTAVVIFRVNLGPLAGNGIEPVNLAVGGGRGYTANASTTNISVFDATGGSTGVRGVIDLHERLPTRFNEKPVRGVAVNTTAHRLYVYALDTVTGGSIVLLAVDTVTNTPVEVDPDGDGRPGLTLFRTPPPSAAGLKSLPPWSILGYYYSNLVAVDEGRGRIYAVVPGVVEVTDGAAGRLVNIVPGGLLVIDGRNDALAIVAIIDVGEMPTGVAVNPETNRVYVTNRGSLADDGLFDGINDSVTVIDGNTLVVTATIGVGQVPLGVKVDPRNNVIYVSNYYAVSVINGQTDAVIQTIPTGGNTDLAVLVGGESDLLPVGRDRIYVNDHRGTVIECDVADLNALAPCQTHQPSLAVPLTDAKLAINESHTLLFGARRFANAVEVVDLATQAPAEPEIVTGVSVGGLAVDRHTGRIYVSNFIQKSGESNRLFVIEASDGSPTFSAIELTVSEPRQVEVDEVNGRIYVVSPSYAVLLALDRATHAELSTVPLGPFGKTLAVDPRFNLLYVSTSGGVDQPPLLRVFDGVTFAPLAEVPFGRAGNPEGGHAVAVDEERNLIYVIRFSNRGGNPARVTSALVVVRGPEFDAITRTLRSPPKVVAEIPHLNIASLLNGIRQIALDMEHNLIYVVGSFQTSDPTDITVLDGYKIIDAQGQIVPNPERAVLGVIPLRGPLGSDGAPVIPRGDSFTLEIAFNRVTRLLYVVTKFTPSFTEGFLSVIDGTQVIDDHTRTFISQRHPTVKGALVSQIAILPAGLDPQFIAVDPARKRVIVTNQSLGALSIFQELSAR